MLIVPLLCTICCYFIAMHVLHGVLCSCSTLVPSGPVFLGSVLQYHMGLLPVLVPGHCDQTIVVVCYVLFVCDLRLCCTVSIFIVLIMYKHFCSINVQTLYNFVLTNSFKYYTCSVWVLDVYYTCFVRVLDVYGTCTGRVLLNKTYELTNHVLTMFSMLFR